MTSTRFALRKFMGLALAMLSVFSTTSAQAVDGCKFLLCIAGPWNSISECRPTVHQVLRDLARGRPLPTCNMGSAGNSADNIAVDEASCPSMYRQYGDNIFIACTYPARISVHVNGGLWSQVYWNAGGGTSTWYSSQARASLTQQAASMPLDEQYLSDLSRWNAANTSQVAQCRPNGGMVMFDRFGAFERCKLPVSESEGD